MPKYIDADEFVRLKREWYCEQCEKRKGMKRGKLQFVYEIGDAPCRACDVDDVISDIEDFPEANVEPVRHGRWEETTEYIGWSEDTCAECSVCGEDYVLSEWSMKDFVNTMRYCPNCGAKMDAEPPKGEDYGNRVL